MDKLPLNANANLLDALYSECEVKDVLSLAEFLALPVSDEYKANTANVKEIRFPLKPVDDNNNDNNDNNNLISNSTILNNNESTKSE
jgi:hypothetical protein